MSNKKSKIDLGLIIFLAALEKARWTIWKFRAVKVMMLMHDQVKV